jgi:nitrite reductase/ring-hydroxylating ferredoxin subunit
MRVAEQADFPVGASRVVTWGPRILLIVHSADQEYAALQGTSPVDGCILNWDPVTLRVISPCGFVVYDLHGNVVRGLTTVPLQRYAVFLRQGTVYVRES